MEIDYFSPVAVGRLLEERKLRLTKRFGQNFLIDRNKARQIVSLMGLAAGDTVLEIGPGLGTMSRLFLDASCRTVAVEIDRGLCTLLRDSLGADPRFELHHADFLKWDVSFMPAGRLQVYSSLPYNAASQILMKLAEQGPDRLIRLTVLLPDEIVTRLTAVPGSAAYGVFSVFADSFFRVENASVRVDRECFFPRPKVDSRCVLLAPLRGGNARGFVSFVSRFFQRRRKLFTGTLRLLAEQSGLEKELPVIRAVGGDLSPDARPEDVPAGVYRRLYGLFSGEKIFLTNGRELISN